MLDTDLGARQFHIVILKFINISKMTLNTVLRIQSNVKWAIYWGRSPKVTKINRTDDIYEIPKEIEIIQSE